LHRFVQFAPDLPGEKVAALRISAATTQSGNRRYCRATAMSYVATSTGDHRVPNKLDRPRADESLEDEFQRTVWDEVSH
jgi:hypothetical protein